MIRRVAVIVPAANEEQHISKCLASIMTARNQLYRSSQNVRVQIFVVLDNCQDATADLARAFGDVRSLAIAAGNVGTARWTGARAAAGTSDHASELWLASTDADSEVTPDWLTHMVAEARRGAHMILGTVLPSPDLHPAVRAQWLDRHHLRNGHPACAEPISAYAPTPTTRPAAGSHWRPARTRNSPDGPRRQATCASPEPPPIP